jgi:hypothetical protein
MLSFMKRGGKRKEEKKEDSLKDSNSLKDSLLDEEYSPQTELPRTTSVEFGRVGSRVAQLDAALSPSQATGNEEAKRRRQWERDGYQWDFCLVLPNPEDEPFKELMSLKPVSDEDTFKTHTEIIEVLHLAGLETYQYYSGDADEIFIKVRAPLAILRRHAENVSYKMLMDPAYLKLHVENKDEPIGSNPEHTLLSPYECVYTSYDDTKRPLFAKADGYRHPFSSILRIKLIYDIITNDEEDCCSLNLRRLTTEDGTKSFKSYFPLHDDERRNQLARMWFSWSVRPWEQPLDDVKEYVGEKIALYFAFTGHYTT